MNHVNSDAVIFCKRYVESKNYQQSIMIIGSWGCGKTWFVKNVLIPELVSLNKKPIIVSAAGAKSASELMGKINDKVLGWINGPMKMSERMLGRGSNIGKKLSVPGAELTSTVVEQLAGISDWSRNLLASRSLDKQDFVIFIDDLERSDIESRELFGLINSLSEEREIKLILICNRDMLAKDEKELIKYRDLFEKSISAEIHIDPVEDSFLNEVISLCISDNTNKFLSDKYKAILDILQSIKDKNLRSVKIALANFEMIDKILTEELIDRDKIPKELLDGYRELLLRILLVCAVESRGRINSLDDILGILGTATRISSRQGAADSIFADYIFRVYFGGTRPQGVPGYLKNLLSKSRINILEVLTDARSYIPKDKSIEEKAITDITSEGILNLSDDEASATVKISLDLIIQGKLLDVMQFRRVALNVLFYIGKGFADFDNGEVEAKILSSIQTTNFEISEEKFNYIFLDADSGFPFDPVLCEALSQRLEKVLLAQSKNKISAIFLNEGVIGVMKLLTDRGFYGYSKDVITVIEPIDFWNNYLTCSNEEKRSFKKLFSRRYRKGNAILDSERSWILLGSPILEAKKPMHKSLSLFHVDDLILAIRNI